MGATLANSPRATEEGLAGGTSAPHHAQELHQREEGRDWGGLGVQEGLGPLRGDVHRVLGTVGGGDCGHGSTESMAGNGGGPGREGEPGLQGPVTGDKWQITREQEIYGI